MAYGNDNISRDYLSSQPATPSSHADRLFASQTDHSGGRVGSRRMILGHIESSLTPNI